MRSGPLVAASLLLVAGGPARAGFFDAIGLGGGDEEEGTYIERFEPAAAGYRAIAEERPKALGLKRSESYGLIPSPELNAYLNRIIDRLRPAMPVKDVPIEAYAVAAQPPLAQATPDGAVFVNFGLLRNLDSEDALAFVMAHEIAHVLYRHHDTDWFVDSQKFAGQAVAVGAQLKAAAKGTADKSAALVIGANVVTAFSDKVVAPTLWNKDQEDAADRLGADLVVAAGYNIDATFDVLAVLAQWEEKRREQQEAQRKAQSDAMGLALIDAIKSGDQASLISSVTKAGSSLVDEAFAAIGGGDHYAPEERVERLRDYIKRNHRYAPREALIAVPWAREEGPIALVYANYVAAAEALASLGEELVAEGLARAREGARPPTATDAMPRVVLAMALAASGNRRAMYETLNGARKSPEPAFIVYRSMISERLAAGRFDEAIALMGEAKTRLGEPPYLWPYEIALLMAAGRKTEAYAASARCRLEEPDMAESCEAALQGLDSVVEPLGTGVAEKTPATETEPRLTPAKANTNVFRAFGIDK